MKLTDHQKALIAKYGHLFTNAGRNDIVELLERPDLNPFNNAIAATMQECFCVQLRLLEQLEREAVVNVTAANTFDAAIAAIEANPEAGRIEVFDFFAVAPDTMLACACCGSKAEKRVFARGGNWGTGCTDKLVGCPACGTDGPGFTLVRP